MPGQRREAIAFFCGCRGYSLRQFSSPCHFRAVGVYQVIVWLMHGRHSSQSSGGFCCSPMSARAGRISCVQAKPQWAAPYMYQMSLVLIGMLSLKNRIHNTVCHTCFSLMYTADHQCKSGLLHIPLMCSSRFSEVFTLFFACQLSAREQGVSLCSKHTASSQGFPSSELTCAGETPPAYKPSASLKNELNWGLLQRVC